MALAQFRGRMAVRRALGGNEEGLRLGPCLHRSPEALVFAGDLDGRSVAVKQAIGPRSRARTEAQGAELAHKHARLGAGSFRVPEPLLCRPEAGLLVMELADGDPFDVWLGREPDSRGEIVAAAGGWLSAFTRGERVSDDFGGGFWIKKRTEQARALPRGALRDRLDGLVERMSEARSRISNAPLTRARSHGALRPQALIRGDEAIWGIGLGGPHWIAVAKDIATFLVEIEIQSPANGPWGPGGFPEADVAAITGAGGPLHPGEAEVMLPYFAPSELAGTDRQWAFPGRRGFGPGTRRPHARLRPDKAGPTRRSARHRAEPPGPSAPQARDCGWR